MCGCGFVGYKLSCVNGSLRIVSSHGMLHGPIRDTVSCKMEPNWTLLRVAWTSLEPFRKKGFRVENLVLDTTILRKNCEKASSEGGGTAF